MHISREGIELIKHFEGCAKKRPDGKFEAYLCPARVPTLGFGATGPDIKLGMVWTRQQCEDRLIYDLRRFERDVTRLIGNAPTTQNQFDALVSFAFNVGSDIDADTKAEGLGDSTLLRLHNAGAYSEAAQQFARWNKAGGRVLTGLTRRRAAEAELYGK